MHLCYLPDGSFINLYWLLHAGAPTMGLDTNGQPMVIGLSLYWQDGSVQALSNANAAAVYIELKRSALTVITDQTPA
jgi:hypothetical protein